MGKLVPQIRFKGTFDENGNWVAFTNDWQRMDIGDIMTENLKPTVKPKNAYTRLGIRSHTKGTFHELIPQGEGLDVDTMYIVEANNFIVNITFAWEEAWAITTDDDADKLVSHRFPQYSFGIQHYPQFYKYRFKNSKMKYNLMLASPGGAGRNRVLNKTEFLKIPVVTPCFEEQKKISTYFQTLDTLIEKTSKELDGYKKLKQAMLQKMFPKKGAKVPEVRFPEFSEDWVEKKLRDIAEFNPKSDIPDVFEYVDLESVVGTEMVAHRTETKATAPSRAQRVAKKGDLFYQTVRPYQKNNYLFEKADTDYVFSTGYAQMRPYQDGYFLLCLVQCEEFVKVVLDNCTGTSYPAINSNELAKIDVCLPQNITEQVKIGTYFQILDTLIDKTSKELEGYQKLKKAMLQKMFV